MPVKFTRLYPADFTEEQFKELGSIINSIEGYAVIRDYSILKRVSVDVFRSDSALYMIDLVATLRSDHKCRVSIPQVFRGWRDLVEYCTDNARALSNQEWK